MIAMMVLMAMMAMVVLMADDADKGDDIAYHSFQMGEEGAHTRVTSRGSVLGPSCFKLYWASQKPRRGHLDKCCSVLSRVQTTT